MSLACGNSAVRCIQFGPIRLAEINCLTRLGRSRCRGQTVVIFYRRRFVERSPQAMPLKLKRAPELALNSLLI